MTFEFDVVIRVTLLLICVALVTPLLRRASASLRHAVWVMGIAASLAIPVALTVLPSRATISLPVLPVAEIRERQSSPDTGAGQALTPKEEVASHPEPGRGAGKSISNLNLWQTLERQRPSRWNALSAVRALWAAGLFLMLARWGMALAQLRRLRARSTALDGPQWTALVRALQQELHLSGTIELRMAADELPPMTWGMLRSVILLPASAAEWSPVQRRMVLAHELAHVKRGDVLGQFLSQAACSCYWFNPIVWYAIRRLKAERERACDDYVLRLGFPSADYADHLLGIARSVNSGFVRAAVSIAHPSELRSRIVAILNPRMRRYRISGPIAGILSLVVGAAVLALSVVKITALAAMALPPITMIPVPPAALVKIEVPQAPVAQERPFASASEMRAFVDTWCANCHTAARNPRLPLGGLDTTAIRNDAPAWEKVARYLRTSMLSHPSVGEPRPDAVEMRRAAEWLEKELDRDAPIYAPSPGAHRLNRTEYGNAIRDLLSLEIDAAALLPSDDSIDGFDNQVAALRTSPEREQAYVAAANTIAAAAIGRPARQGRPTPLPADTPSRRAIFVCRPATPVQSFALFVSPDTEAVRAELTRQEGCARTVLTNLATRAFRRDPSEGDIEFLLDLYRQNRLYDGREFDAGIEAALRSILTDRRFLYRIETEPAGVLPTQLYRISDFDLASRLSFFLWNTSPDDRLLDLARRGSLHEPATLERETRRMLEDRRAETLALNFAEQWLGVRSLDAQWQGALLHKGIEPDLKKSMRQEIDLFFASVVREDRSVNDLLTADYTFVDDRLAKHYGLPAGGAEFKRVSFPDTLDARLGLLGKSAILATTINPYTGLSIVQRGAFVLRLLGVDAFPPPPDVPLMKPRIAGDPNPPTDRQRLEQEEQITRACVSCHAPIDPLGNALGNFDFTGRWQTEEYGKTIDASVVLVNGAKVNGVADLRNVLVGHSDQFVRAFTERLLIYSLGRGLNYRDMPAVRSITREAALANNRFSAIVLAIVKSPTFQMASKQGNAR